MRTRTRHSSRNDSREEPTANQLPSNRARTACIGSDPISPAAVHRGGVARSLPPAGRTSGALLSDSSTRCPQSLLAILWLRPVARAPRGRPTITPAYLNYPVL